MPTWISPHRAADLRRVAAALRTAQPFARLDPLNPRTPAQVERALGAGAWVLMLPMFTGAAEPARFVEWVAGRARVVGLLETREAVAAVDDIAAVKGLDELHVGLNDLTL